MIRAVFSFSLYASVLAVLTFTGSAQARDRFLAIAPVTSPGGLSAWLVEDHTLPIISLTFGFSGAGAKTDPDTKEGLVSLLSTLLDEGAGDYDSAAFQEALDAHSISLSFGASRDDFTGSLTTLSAHQDTAFELLHLALTAPRFEAEPIARMREAAATRIRSEMTDADWMATRLMIDRAYEGHPYARNSGGTLSSLPRITAKDLRSFKGAFFTRDRLRIAAAGDITPAQLSALLDRLFGDLPAKGTPAEIPELSVQNQGHLYVFDKDMPQTVISLTSPGLRRTDPDYAAAVVADAAFGGTGFGSRLTETIREQAGLTYGISSDLSELDHVATFSIDTSTRNDQVARMLGLIRAEMQKARTEGLTQKEVENARSYLLGSMPMALTSTPRVAGLLLSQRLDDRPVDDLDTFRAQLAAVTVDDANRALRRLLNPDAFVAVLVGRPKGIETLPGFSAPIFLTTLPHVE